MQGITYITNTKGEPEGILMNFKDLKRLNLKTADVIKMLTESAKEIDAAIDNSIPSTSLADALGKFKDKLK